MCVFLFFISRIRNWAALNSEGLSSGPENVHFLMVRPVVRNEWKSSHQDPVVCCGHRLPFQYFSGVQKQCNMLRQFTCLSKYNEFNIKHCFFLLYSVAFIKFLYYIKIYCIDVDNILINCRNTTHQNW